MHAAIITSGSIKFDEDHTNTKMRLSVLLCAAGLTAVSAFAPIGSQTGVTTTPTTPTTVGTFDPLNLAEESLSTPNTDGSSSGTNALGLAAATTAAWVASSDAAFADSPDWGIFEGVSRIIHMLCAGIWNCKMMRSIRLCTF